MSVVAVLPVRGTGGKRRLAGVLAEPSRDALVVVLARHVLEVLIAVPSISRVLVVTTDVEHAEALVAPVRGAAEGAGVSLEILVQPSDAPGLNGAVGAARDRALECGAGKVLAVHADLPLLTSDDVDVLLAAGAAVLAVDDRGTGTNALVLARSLAQRWVYRFGEGSRRDHEEEAQRLGVMATVVSRSGTAHDLDTAADWDSLPPDVRAALVGRIDEAANAAGSAVRLPAAAAHDLVHGAASTPAP